MSDKPVQAPGNGDLEIKDAQVIFNTAWEELTESVGREQLRFPKELILLGGAPGSGKGTQTDFIMDGGDLRVHPLWSRAC